MILDIFPYIYWSHFFCEVSVQLWSPFTDQVICGCLVLSVFTYLYILEINALSEMQVSKISSPSVGCLFMFLIVSFAVKKLFSLIPSHLLIHNFISCTLGVLLRKLVSSVTWWRVCPTFFSSTCNVSGLMPVWVEFCSGWDIGVKFQSTTYGFPVFQHHLLKMLSFLQCVFMVTLSSMR